MTPLLCVQEEHRFYPREPQTFFLLPASENEALSTLSRFFFLPSRFFLPRDKPLPPQQVIWSFRIYLVDPLEATWAGVSFAVDFVIPVPTEVLAAQEMPRIKLTFSRLLCSGNNHALGS